MTLSPNEIALPKDGVPAIAIDAELRALKPDEVRAHWARAFRGPADVQEVGKAAYNLFLSDNGLFSMRAAYMARIETEVTQMCVSLFHPPQGADGTFTSGGSESIYSALHAMREWAKEYHPHIAAPEIVAPYSAHPSFSKGCHYYGLRLVRTALAGDYRASVDAMAQAITPNTIGMVGSAPCWPYGLIDPIEGISALAAARGLWMHVDACVGGYLLPFVEKLGHPVPVWDFRAPGVMSISADLHKYGYCPKPASTVLWRSEDLKRYHYVHPADWPGGQYGMSGIAGSRSAGPIFAAWSVLRYLGSDGYTRLAAQLLDLKAKLVAGIDSIPGLRAWRNDLLPVAFGADGLDLGAVKLHLSKMGWVLVGSAEPPLINIPLDAATTEDILAAFLKDLASAVAAVSGGGTHRREQLQY